MPNPVAHIAKKELREMSRDRRVLTSAFVGPIFLIIVLLLVFGMLEDALSRPKRQTVYVVEAGKGSPLVQGLVASKLFRVVYTPSAAEGRKLIRSGKAKLVLDLGSDLAGTLQRGEAARIEALYDPDDPLAMIPLRIVQQTVVALNKRSVEAVFRAKGVPVSLSEPLKLVEKPVKTGEGLGSSMIVSMVPYLIVLWAFYGGFSIVTELVTGEKEKNTLETLLISPVRRTQIALGKFLALGTVCLASSLTSLVGVILFGFTRLPASKTLFPNGMNVSPAMLLAVAAVLVPLVVLFASVLLAISTFARNTREAQTYLTLVSFVVMMPAIFSQFIGFTEYAQARWIPFVPVLNAAMCIRDALMGKFDGAALGATILTSVVLGAIGLRWAVWMFNREQVLMRV